MAIIIKNNADNASIWIDNDELRKGERVIISPLRIFSLITMFTEKYTNITDDKKTEKDDINPAIFFIFIREDKNAPVDNIKIAV